MNKLFKLSHKQRHWIDFLLAMTEKEIKARYKHAVLGFLWVILNPLLQMLVLGFVFHFFMPVNVDNYFLFLFSGLLPWNLFSMSLTKTTSSIVYERSLIQKANFPRETIPLSIILSNMFHFLISLGLLLILLIGDKIFLEHYSVMALGVYASRFLGLIPLLLWLLILTTSLSLLLAALNVKYRDVNFIVQAVMPLWFYVTPVVYTLNLLPESLRPLFYLNPMTAIIEGFHRVLLNLSVTTSDLMIISLTMTFLAVFFGWRVFKQESKNFDDWV
ncbi:MAG: ABC transporter permease [Candidatus Pacebacteria bacterium]|nr:ABC transporter permease [Candidatus Paceibacterota bacterium]MBT6899255.1 ABC transporter permease [Candidatus Paceibacterota bacterium]MBT7184155.1 ABC transporter permease [Candidatus Paceibacterota bacterium]MBT7310013.1 ABC transporter permease [Candidatus Paceibacterota bacterium]